MQITQCLIFFTNQHRYKKSKKKEKKGRKKNHNDNFK